MKTVHYGLRFALSVLLFLLTCLPAPAASPAKQDQGFDLFVVPTVDDRLDSWLKVPPTLNPTIHMVETVYPNQPFALRLLFRNYARSGSKNVHITYDVRVFDPDGQPTADHGEDLLAYRGSIANPAAIIINQQFLRIMFDESYPPGDYRIRVVATDHMTGQPANATGTVTLAPFERSGNFVSFDFFNFWLRNYSRKPDVGKAVFGLLQFLEADPHWLADHPALVAFAHRLLRDNPWLEDHLLEMYRAGKSPGKDLVTLLALGQYRVPELFDTAGPEQKAWFEHVRNLVQSDAEKSVLNAEEIAAAWGEFYATGHLDPIREVVRLLEPFALSDPSEAVRSHTEPEKAAFWSLVEHGREVPLVAKFCTYLLEHSALTPQNKVQLRLALQLIEKSLKQETADSLETEKKRPLPQTR